MDTLCEAGDLDVDNDSHRWLFAYLFLADINTSLERWRRAHNAHPMADVRNRTSDQQFFSGMTTHGIRGVIDFASAGWAGYLPSAEEHQMIEQEAATIQQFEQIQSEVRGQVHAHDPQGPFMEDASLIKFGRQVDRISAGVWRNAMDRWRAALAIMYNLLDIERM